MISSRTFFWLVDGELSGSQHHWPSGSTWSGVFLLVDNMLSLIINFSHLEEFSVSAKQLKGIVCILDGELRPCLKAALLFILTICSSLLSYHLPSLINNCLNLPPWNSGKVMEVEWRLFSIIKEMRVRERLCARGPAWWRICLFLGGRPHLVTGW